jgi:toxin ParE1/3/4
MTTELVWVPRAREDLLDIYITIGFDNPDAAERFYDTIEARANTLVQHPHLGPRRPDIRPATRVLVEGPYLILYEIHPDADEGRIDRVDIIRVVDGRRDLTKLF